MAERSQFWTTGSTGDGASQFTQQQLLEWLRDSFLGDRYTTEGVLPAVGGDLKVTGSSSPISVAEGAAYVYGFYYQNTSAVSLTVPTATAGTTGHRVVLRADWTAQTVRVVLKSSADGTSSAPALTQTASTTWEISLATLTRTTGGTITITDTRDWVHLGQTPIWRRLGGDSTNWATVGTTSYTPGPARIQVGATQITFSSSATSNLITVTFPTAFSGTPVVIPSTFSNGSSTGRKMLVTVESVSSTQVGLRGYIVDGSTTSSSFDCYWIAIGPK